MNLRDQLKDILPDILPRNPAKAIKGTELIESVKDKLENGYSDATLRYHFSIMSCDPSSPIAKVEQGQGYYLRSTTIHTLNSARSMIFDDHGLGMTSNDADLSIARVNKFRAVVQRYFESSSQFPFAFERSFSGENASGNRWRVPDLTIVNWLVGDVLENGSVHLNHEKLEVQRRLSKAPLTMTNVKLRLEVSKENVLENLYQCHAAGQWADHSELMIASPIQDPQLLEEIRQFAAANGIGITTFNMDGETIDDLPEAAAIDNLTVCEFEQILSLLSVERIASHTPSQSFDWQKVSTFATTNEDFSSLQGWINHCLINESILSVREFNDSQVPPRTESVA